MSIIVILARIVHIFSAVLWMGGFAAFMIHIQPAANRTMPASGSFFLSFIKTFSPFMVAVASLTVLGGATLYWIDSAGLRLGWITTPSGLGFTFGGLCGLSAWIMGVFVVKPRVDRLTLLSSQVAARNKPPTPEEGAEMGKLSGSLVTLGRATLALLMFALLGMATARYL